MNFPPVGNNKPFVVYYIDAGKQFVMAGADSEAEAKNLMSMYMKNVGSEKKPSKNSTLQWGIKRNE